MSSGTSAKCKYFGFLFVEVFLDEELDRLPVLLEVLLVLFFGETVRLLDLLEELDRLLDFDKLDRLLDLEKLDRRLAFPEGFLVLFFGEINRLLVLLEELLMLVFLSVPLGTVCFSVTSISSRVFFGLSNASHLVHPDSKSFYLL